MPRHIAIERCNVCACLSLGALNKFPASDAIYASSSENCFARVHRSAIRHFRDSTCHYRGSSPFPALSRQISSSFYRFPPLIARCPLSVARLSDVARLTRGSSKNSSSTYDNGEPLCTRKAENLSTCALVRVRRPCGCDCNCEVRSARWNSGAYGSDGRDTPFQLTEFTPLEKSRRSPASRYSAEILIDTTHHVTRPNSVSRHITKGRGVLVIKNRIDRVVVDAFRSLLTSVVSRGAARSARHEF